MPKIESFFLNTNKNKRETIIEKHNSKETNRNTKKKKKNNQKNQQQQQKAKQTKQWYIKTKTL